MDPMQQVNDNHVTNQSFTSMLVDATIHDVTNNKYDVTMKHLNQAYNSGINPSTVPPNSHHTITRVTNKKGDYNHNQPPIRNQQWFASYQQVNQPNYSNLNGNQANQSYNNQDSNQQTQRYHQQNNGVQHQNPNVSNYQNTAFQGCGPQHINQVLNQQHQTIYHQNINDQYYHPNVSHQQDNFAANQGQQHVLNSQAIQQHYQGFGRQQLVQYPHSGHYNNQQYSLMQNPQRSMDTDVAVNSNRKIHKSPASNSKPGSDSEESESKKARKSRIKFTRHQMEVLKYEFNRSMYLPNDKKKNISTVTGLTEEEVYNWFQNSRAKFNREMRGVATKKYSRKTKSAQSENVNKEKQTLDENKPKLRKMRITLDFDQTEILEDYYKNVTWFPLIDQFIELSCKTGMTEVELTTWFQNRRRKDRKMGFEINKMIDRNVRRGQFRYSMNTGMI